MKDQSNQSRLVRVPSTAIERGLELVAQIALGIEMALLYLRFAPLRDATSPATLAGLFFLVAFSAILYVALSFARRLPIASLPQISRIRESNIDSYARLLRTFIAFLKAFSLVLLGVSEWMWIQVALGASEAFAWVLLLVGVVLIMGAFLAFFSAVKRLT